MCIRDRSKYCDACGPLVKRELQKQWFAEHPEYAKQWYIEHQNEQRERSKHYNANHQNEQREYLTHYNAEHPEYKKQWFAEHPEYSSEHCKQYRAAHPEMCAVYNGRRRAFINGNGGSYTVDELNALFEQQEGFCFYCGELLYASFETTFHIDHKIPLSRGGSNNIENIALSCAACNLSKHT